MTKYQHRRSRHRLQQRQSIKPNEVNDHGTWLIGTGFGNSSSVSYRNDLIYSPCWSSCAWSLDHTSYSRDQQYVPDSPPPECWRVDALKHTKSSLNNINALNGMMVLSMEWNPALISCECRSEISSLKIWRTSALCVLSPQIEQGVWSPVCSISLSGQSWHVNRKVMNI